MTTTPPPPTSDNKPTNKPTRIAVFGAAGRVGKRLIALSSATPDTDTPPDTQLVAAIVRTGHADLGKDAGTLAGIEPLGVPVTDPASLTELADDIDVMIDFSLPEGCRQAIDLCVEHRIPLVIGTTGLTDADHARIDEAAQTIPILQAPNMSLGVNLLLNLVGQVAQQLQQLAGDTYPNAYDIEIVEAHHRFKKDAPSGTAVALAEAICQATGKSKTTDVIHGRHGDHPRTPNEIAIHALRLGDVIGQHDIHFHGLGECITLSHNATNRDVFAQGALHAAKWLSHNGIRGKRSTMKDVIQSSNLPRHDSDHLATDPYKQARLKYKPEEISCLLIAESPPKSEDRFFYFEDVPKQDSLFLEIAKVLYPSMAEAYLNSGRNPEQKELILKKFCEDGYFLEDLHEVPIGESPYTDQEAASKLTTKLSKIITNETPIILIKANVFDAAYPLFKSKGFNVHNQRLPFPGSGQQKVFRDTFSTLIADI